MSTASQGASRLDDGDDRVHEETVAPRAEHRAPGTPQRTQSSDGVNITMPPQRGDEVRWGPIWAGLVVTLGVFLLLELVAFAVGIIDLGQGANDGTASGVATGIIGLIAFFVGGLTAGATAMWHGFSSGLLQGIMVWATSVVAIVFLSVVGGGALLGSLGQIASQLTDLGTVTSAAQGANPPKIDPAQALETARSSASWAVLGLGVTVVASALGGLVGAKMWKGKDDQAPVVSRHNA